MHYLWHILGWTMLLLFALLGVSLLLNDHWTEALILLSAALLTAPSSPILLRRYTKFPLHPLWRVLLIVGLLASLAWLFLNSQVTSIYKSPQVKARFMQLYAEKMAGWPLDYEDLYLQSSYGRIHVIASGNPEGPPLLLLHASGVSSWSWKYNAAALGGQFRLYAVDLIGDAGKSAYTDLGRVMRSGRDQAELYNEIIDRLGLERVYLVGASEGGFIATNFALYHPERVEKMVLLGPMGYAGALPSVVRIMFAQLFPLGPVQRSTFDWAFGNNATVRNDFADWFLLVMDGTYPVKVAPLPFSQEQRRALQVPVLFLFGQSDRLVGDPEAARLLVGDIPTARVKVISAGHLIAAERPAEVNTLILDFLQQ